MQWATTSWTQVLAAREAPTSEARLALEGLCQAYWYPLYVFVRHQGYDPDDARDLTQAYFAELLEKEHLADFDPELGRFRVFLKASIKHFLSKEREKAAAWKRGGRTSVLSLDADAESRYQLEPVDRLDPEKLYERRWALTLVERVLEGLQEEARETGREAEFDHLKGLLTGQQPRVPYKEIAAELGTTEDAVKAAVRRLRQRFGKLLREEIGATVSTPEEVDDEVRHLLGVIAPWAPPPS